MTREEIHKLPWKAQEYINELQRKLTLTDVVSSNVALLWWGWCTVWGIVGFVFGCIKLWNYYT